MQANPRITIVGAGAIGGWVAARLALAGAAPTLLARGAALTAIAQHGLRFETGQGPQSLAIEVCGDAAAIGAQDLVVFAVKAHALAAAARMAQPLIGPDTILIPMANGVPWWFLADRGIGLGSVDPENRIAAALPLRQVIGCVVHASVDNPAPGRIVHVAGNGLIVGEPEGPPGDRLEQVANLFDRAGFAVTCSADIRYDIWYKLWGNMTLNPMSALTGADCGAILDDALLEAFILSAMEEGRAIGASVGCAITESGRDRIAVARKLGAFRTSMLQDAAAGRPLELDALLAAPREIAAGAGIATPVLDALHGLARLFAKTQGLAVPSVDAISTRPI